MMHLIKTLHVITTLPYKLILSLLCTKISTKEVLRYLYRLACKFVKTASINTYVRSVIKYQSQHA